MYIVKLRTRVSVSDIAAYVYCTTFNKQFNNGPYLWYWQFILFEYEISN